MNSKNARNRTRVAVSREGMLFVFFLAALAGAAIYSGRNGLMLLFCCIFAAFVILVIFARQNFSRPVRLERRFVEEIFAGRDTRIDVIIRNEGRRPVYGLHIFERFEGGAEIGPMFVRKLAPGEAATARYMCYFQNRGNAHFCGFEIRSRFPLPFFELRRDVDIDDNQPVYPQPVPETDLLAFAQTASDRRPPRFHQRQTAIRELVHGRRSGRMLWKLSVRRQAWVEEAPARAKARQVMPAVLLVDKKILGPEKYERQISQVTAFILNQIQHDAAGELLIGNTRHAYGNSPLQRREVLEALAAA